MVNEKPIPDVEDFKRQIITVRYENRDLKGITLTRGAEETVLGRKCTVLYWETEKSPNGCTTVFYKPIDEVEQVIRKRTKEYADLIHELTRGE